MAKNVQKKSENKKTALPKWALWVSIVLVVSIAGVVYFLTRPSPPEQPVAATPESSSLVLEMNVDKAFILFKQGAAFVDIRSSAEWEAYHIENSISIPLEELSSRLEELSRDNEIVVVDQWGDLSLQGRDILLEAGFQNVTSMTGGMDQWVFRGYPFIGTAPY